MFDSGHSVYTQKQNIDYMCTVSVDPTKHSQ